MTGTIRAVVDGAVGTLLIDNAPRRNAMTLDMYASLPAAVEALRAAPGLRVVVLRGAGDVAFGAGSDISEFPARRMGAAAASYNAIEAAAARAIESVPVPVVALIHGACMGGGMGLALCADLRYAADDAMFAVTPARLGVGYPPDALARLVATVGRARATQVVFTAERIDAATAERIGLVNQVIAKAELDAHVAAVTAGIATLAPLTLRAAKLALRGAAPHDLDAAIAVCFDSADYREGIQAYLEKRAPRFEGR